MRKKDIPELPKWFGGFLRQQRERQQMSRRELVERAEEVESPIDIPPPNEAMFTRLENGTSRQFDVHDPTHLRFLQHVYRADIPLLYAAYPEPTATSVRLQHEKDFLDLEDNDGVGTTYRVASRRLAGAAQAITWLHLQPGGSSRLHFHEGKELAVVISGQVTFEIIRQGEAEPQNVQLHFQDILHFDSHHEHRAINTGADDAVVLIVRFHQSDQTSPSAKR